MVVTIVVLLILAGVSISLVVDKNGIIQKSKDARREYGTSKTNEQKQMDSTNDWIDETVTGNLKGTKETKPYLPNEDYTKVPGTSLDNGLVIADKKGNEYVWVEVPKTDTVYAKSGLKITEFSAEELASIKTDLLMYTTGGGYSDYADTWYSGCGIADADTYTDKYNKMLKSVYQNGGFWIGRYEIGIDENTTRSFGTDHSTEHPTEGQTPVIKKNKVPYNWIRCSQAESLAEAFAPTGYTSSLLFGLQWDLVCKYLKTKTTDDLLQNSKEWGNYKDASFDITNIDAMYSEDDGISWKKVSKETNKTYNKASSKSVLLTTGAETRNSMLNICDFAGNLEEWTLQQYCFAAIVPCVSRGSSYTGATSTVTSWGPEEKNTSEKYLGARVSLY